MKIDKEYLKEIIKHCQDEYPKEACGVVAGEIVKNKKCNMKRIAKKVYKMKNTSDAPETCYFMEPPEQFSVFKEMREMGYELLGIYHSHTNSPAYPSKRDMDLAFYPEAIYIIISLMDFNCPQINGFKIVENKIYEEEIRWKKCKK